MSRNLPLSGIVTPNRAVFTVLRIMIIFLYVATLTAQIAIPFEFLQIENTPAAVAEFPLLGPMRIVYTVVALLAILCVQIAFAFILKLLRLVQSNQIFDVQMMRPVDGIIICFTIATAVLFIGWVAMLSTGIGNPGTFFVASTVGTTALGMTLLMIVMRSLLLRAISQHTELEEVI